MEDIRGPSPSNFFALAAEAAELRGGVGEKAHEGAQLRMPTKEQIRLLLAKFADTQEMALGPVPTWRGGSRIPDRERCRLQAAEEKNILYVERSMDMVQARGGKKRPRSSHPVVLAREAGGQHGKEGLGGGVNCSVYVNGLPAGITVTRLEQIFSAHGKVRRSKFYKAGAGGDALVTFAKPNSAKMAALRLNGLQLPEGAKLEVSLADFTRRRQGEGQGGDGLPRECGAHQHPVVVLKNMYSAVAAAAAPQGPSAAAQILRQDIRDESQKHGTVLSIVGPIDPLDAGSRFSGAVAVTFETPGAAMACAAAMQGRHYGSRLVEAQVLGKLTGTATPPPAPAPAPPQKQNTEDDLLDDFFKSV